MRYRPKRENYTIGQFGEIDYKEMLERYCTYLEKQNKQLRIGGVIPKGTLCEDCKEVKKETITLCKECYLKGC